MEPVRVRLRNVDIGTGADRALLTLDREDYSALYPGMARFVLTLSSGDHAIAVFRTNTYEYSPLFPLTAETVAMQRADAWEEQYWRDPAGFIEDKPTARQGPAALASADLVVIQGSPHADGNCSILAGWAVDAAHGAGRTTAVIYPHDMDIHCCIGCYQCYNTSTCIFHDDMGEVIGAIRGAVLLIVCSPVYTNTVPGGLKLLIDRMQAYHAERQLEGGPTGQQGLIFSVAGRTGEDNFTCITRVLKAFMSNLGIRPSGNVLIDRTDSVNDIRTVEGLEEKVKEAVLRAFTSR